MTTVFPIVEGHGDVKAVPALLRRIAIEFLGVPDLICLQPYRLPRTKLANRAEFEKALVLASLKLRDARPPVLRLVLMDADNDCPLQLLEELKRDHEPLIGLVPTSVVFAVREFETWFLAAPWGDVRHRALRGEAANVPDPEAVSDAKRAFREKILVDGSPYSEVVDQVRFAELMPLAPVRRSCRSFDKLVRDLERNLAPTGHDPV